jgi:hypothetical protein
MKTCEKRFGRLWQVLVAASCLCAGATKIASAQSLPQQAGDFITLKAALALGYELKAVIKEGPVDPKNDPRDLGSEILYIQKGPSLLICVGPKRHFFAGEEHPRALCMPPRYLRD